MNTIRNVGDLIKALSVYSPGLPISFKVDNASIGRGLNNDTSIAQLGPLGAPNRLVVFLSTDLGE